MFEPNPSDDDSKLRHPALAGLVTAFNGRWPDHGTDWVDFAADDLWIDANVDPLTNRVRVRVYLPTDDMEVVQAWVNAQPAPLSGIVQSAFLDDDSEWRPRLVFERPAGTVDWVGDPLFDDLDRFRTAWLADTAVRLPTQEPPSFKIMDDPRLQPPQNAWLLKGSESSFPTPEFLARNAEADKVGIFTFDWTTAAQTLTGDLVLFYFVAPRKAVHFVARAATNAFFSREIEVVADGRVSPAQWWGKFTTPIEIEQISVDTLRGAVGGYLPLRGRSGLYLRPESIDALQFRAVDPDRQAELDRLVALPVGRPEFPDLATMTTDEWRSLAAGALSLEAEVSRYLVEPVLRQAVAPTGLTWTAEYPVGNRRADYVILNGAAPVHVVEVKKVIKEGPDGDWSRSPDFKQLRWYADRLGTSATLIDSHRIVLVDKGGVEPSRQVSRTQATAMELAAVHNHLRGP